MTKIEEPKAMKKIHEIREQIYNETKNMTIEERVVRENEIAKEVAKKYGFKIQKIA